MSALAMVLMAGMAVTASGPELVSAEMEQGLDLSGEWEGVLVWHGRKRPVELRGGTLVEGRLRVERWRIGDVVDEGGGRFRTKAWTLYPTVGTYDQDGDSLRMCWGDASKGYPTSVHPEEGQELLILRRVKPGK